MRPLRQRATAAWCALALLGAAFAAQADEPAGWGYFGGNSDGSRYSSARQINRDNVGKLELAWTYSTGELARRSPELIANSSTQTTPVLVDGNLIFCTPFNRVIALDPATGLERWTHDPQVALDHTLPFQYNCRGVSAWRDPDAAPGSLCASRVLMGTADSRLIALDTGSGKRCPGFGSNGEITVTRAWPDKFPGEAKLTSAPVVVNGVVALGSAIMDNIRSDAPPGTVFAFDARTGAARWHFEPIPRDPADPAYATWLEGSALRTGAANVWSTMVADEARGIIYAPVGSASPDFYGGMRKGDNLYSSSLVALDASTGKPIWHFQTVHHDIWDYDVSAPPLLAELRHGGTTVPAVVQNTKQGFVFVFDRVTGKPLFPIEERPVPQGGLPGEWLSPTQPFPVKPEPLVPTSITPDDAWGFTFWDKAQCRKLIESTRNEGIFTPPSLQGSAFFPSDFGGNNWGTPAIDPERGLIILNTLFMPSVVKLIPREQCEIGKDLFTSPQFDTPYCVQVHPMLSPLGVPCSEPPWGTLAAIDMNTGDKRWEVPLGTLEEMAPWPISMIKGAPNIGGPSVSAGGLTFIAATPDMNIRAFDSETGEELWKAKLPTGGHATPTIYRASKDQKQYVVIAAGGHFGMPHEPAGDWLVAFALPD